MEEHLVPHAVVEDDGEPVEPERLLQHPDEVGEEALEVAS
jgi:hypothetical protein